MIPHNISLRKIRVSAEEQNFLNKAIRDPSSYFLLISNLITIYFAVVEGWNLMTVIGVYWFQSIIIGFFNFIRVLTLKDSSTAYIWLNGLRVYLSSRTIIILAIFFTLTYSLVHLIYLFFLVKVNALHIDARPPLQPEADKIFFLSSIFFLNHLFSFLYNRAINEPEQNIFRIILFSYERLIPIIIIPMCGLLLIPSDPLINKGVLALFLLLKTYVDLYMHYREHAYQVQAKEEGKI